MRLAPSHLEVDINGSKWSIVLAADKYSLYHNDRVVSQLYVPDHDERHNYFFSLSGDASFRDVILDKSLGAGVLTQLCLATAALQGRSVSLDECRASASGEHRSVMQLLETTATALVALATHRGSTGATLIQQQPVVNMDDLLAPLYAADNRTDTALTRMQARLDTLVAPAAAPSDGAALLKLSSELAALRTSLEAADSASVARGRSGDTALAALSDALLARTATLNTSLHAAQALATTSLTSVNASLQSQLDSVRGALQGVSAEVMVEVRALNVTVLTGAAAMKEALLAAETRLLDDLSRTSRLLEEDAGKRIAVASVQLQGEAARAQAALNETLAGLRRQLESVEKSVVGREAQWREAEAALREELARATRSQAELQVATAVQASALGFVQNQTAAMDARVHELFTALAVLSARVEGAAEHRVSLEALQREVQELRRGEGAAPQIETLLGRLNESLSAAVAASTRTVLEDGRGHREAVLAELRARDDKDAVAELSRRLAVSEEKNQALQARLDKLETMLLEVDARSKACCDSL